MASKRKLIRQAVAAILGTASGDPPVYPTAAGANVFPFRARNVPSGRLPAICVYTRRDRLDNNYNGLQSRELGLTVEILAKANEDLDDTLDDIALTVETLLDADDTFGETAERSYFEETIVGLFSEGANIYGSASLTYRVDYVQEPVLPEDLDDFLLAQIGVDIDGVGDVLTGDEYDLTVGRYYHLIGGDWTGRTTGDFFIAAAADAAAFTSPDQMVQEIGTIKTGDADDLPEGVLYRIIEGTINGKTSGIYEASAADEADFTSADQVVCLIDHRTVVTIPQ